MGGRARPASLSLLVLLLAAALAAPGCRRHVTLPDFDADRAFRDLEQQVAFGPRVPGTEAHRRCLEFLRRRLEEAGARVSVQAAPDTDFALPGVDTLYNVRARFGAPGRPHLVLGAHWDSRPWADREPDSTRRAQAVPGANDGASGVAVLLEVARALGQQPPPVGVEIVLFDGEDAGHEGDPGTYARGSQAYVLLLEHPFPLHTIVVDMVGRRGLRVYQEVTSRESAANLVDRLWEGARKTGGTAFVPELRHQVFDDHVPFVRAGIPAVDLIDLEDPNWHTLGDVPAACDPGSLRQVGRVLLWHLYTLELETP